MFTAACILTSRITCGFINTFKKFHCWILFYEDTVIWFINLLNPSTKVPSTTIPFTTSVLPSLLLADFPHVQENEKTITTTSRFPPCLSKQVKKNKKLKIIIKQKRKKSRKSPAKTVLFSLWTKNEPLSLFIKDNICKILKKEIDECHKTQSDKEGGSVELINRSVQTHPVTVSKSVLILILARLATWKFHLDKGEKIANSVEKEVVYWWCAAKMSQYLYNLNWIHTFDVNKNFVHESWCMMKLNAVKYISE